MLKASLIHTDLRMWLRDSFMTSLSLYMHMHRVKDLENREESHKRLRAIKHKRRYYPKKVCTLSYVGSHLHTPIYSSSVSTLPPLCPLPYLPSVSPLPSPPLSPDLGQETWNNP